VDLLAPKPGRNLPTVSTYPRLPATGFGAPDGHDADCLIVGDYVSVVYRYERSQLGDLGHCRSLDP
jgi:hypothetical protein